MACGAAVITSDRGSLPEVSGGHALFAPPGDVEALAACMARLLEDSALRSELIQQGLSHAAKFSWKVAAEAHVKLYREIADAR
jgi:glycosyltransferase involved in cell wall biosynthesis